MVSYKDYSPHHEWMLATGYLLSDIKADRSLFWLEECPALVAKHHRGITDVIDGLEMYHGRVEKFMQEQYGFLPREADQIKEAVLDLCQKMSMYLKTHLDQVEDFYKMGFFDEFDSLYEAAEVYAKLNFDADSPDTATMAGDAEFALVLICYFYYLGELELPVVYENEPNTKYNLSRIHITFAIHGHLFRFFYIGETAVWKREPVVEDISDSYTPDFYDYMFGDLSDSIIEGPTVCNHRGHSILQYDKGSFCSNCGDTVPDDHSVFDDSPHIIDGSSPDGHEFTQQFENYYGR